MSKQYFFNFTILDEPIQYGTLRFTSVESFYQAMKTLDQTVREEISHLGPTQAKRRGRQVDLRPDWDAAKLKVMEYGLSRRYVPGSFDAKKLMGCQGDIVEWNRHCDIYWGCCLCDDHKGIGENHLGILLMKLRDDLITMSPMQDGLAAASNPVIASSTLAGDSYG